MCKNEQIDTQGISWGCCISEREDKIEYLSFKNARNSFKLEDTVRDEKVFVETLQTFVLKKLLGYISCGQSSKVMLFGPRDSGKTAVLQQYAALVKKNLNNSYVCSIYSCNGLR